ncbi:hypothetical protein C8R44DRAFT_870602 [Mycena epipterygia]|nr:hypothetical protein C8R44DRAFT_870602 [Mycena epipterygia]
MPMDFPENSPSEVWQVLSDARTTNSMILAALSLVAYDHLITLPDEVIASILLAPMGPVLIVYVKVELMWRSGISTTNTIYLWNRYFTLIALSYDASVQLRPFKSDSGEAATSTLILATVDFILVLRVWILYGKKRVLLYFLVPMIGYYWDLSWPLTGCYPHGNVPRYFAFYSVPVLVVSMTMFLMTAYKCGKTLLTHGRARMPIYNMFLRDGIFWFVAIFVTFIPEVIIWARARQTLAELLIAPGLAVTSIIGSRVLLNIKGLKLAKVLPTTTAATALGTTIELDTIDYPSRIPWGTVGTTDGANLTIPDVP